MRRIIVFLDRLDVAAFLRRHLHHALDLLAQGEGVVFVAAAGKT
jgi:hypothetical protein